MFARLAGANPNRLYLGQCLFFLVALGLVFSLASPYFLSLTNLANILSASAVIGLIAIGSTFVIAAGCIDLSAAAVMALCATVCAWLLHVVELPPAAAMTMSLALGGVCGGVTGMLVNVTKAPSFIVSLGMLSIVRAGAYIVSHGMPIYGLSEAVTAIGQGRAGGVPIPALILAVAALLAYALLSRTQFGAHAMIMGDNHFAARAMGLPTDLLRIKIFALAGLCSGMAGLVFMMRTNSGDPSAGQNYELIAITAVILGGANLFGGRAGIPGTMLGILCLGMLQNGLNLLAVSTYYQILFVGVVLVAAAFLSRPRSGS